MKFSRSNRLGVANSLLYSLVLFLSTNSSQAQIPCEYTSDCRKVLSISGLSACVDGFCTNPFSQGCLRIMDHEKGGGSLFEDDAKFPQRVCNSDDAAANDFSNCYKPRSLFETYPEIRIGAGDWESSIFLAWIMQILLGELLQVPVTVETASPRSAGSVSFYDVPNGMVYPAVPYNYDALKRADELNGDCTRADLDSGSDTCVHLLPEVWSGQINAYTAALEEGFVEPPEGNGMVGKFSFMIPRFATELDPSLTSWHGLQDRQKMAETFLRPTTWLEYCNQVSTSKCAEPDDTCKRSPKTPDEGALYFLEGEYTGHFRATDKNNCTKYPDTCTGHVVDPPCEWDTLTESQMYWNNIALTSDGPVQPNNGYSYFQMLEVWHAANATKSPVFLWWWKPDSLDQLYANTDFALQPTFLPPPTEECEKNRVTNVDRCTDDPVIRRGNDPIGSCDTPAHSLQKVISTGLYTATFAEPEATRSPAYEFVKRFRVSDLSLTIMLREWIHTKVDTYGIDPRIAVCEWVYDNLDDLQGKFIPPGYPRVFEEETSKPMVIASFALGFLALAMAVVSTLGTLKYQETLIFKYAHVPFVLWILTGLVMVSVGAILVAPHPSNGLCVAQPYLISLGYTIELMPLVVKVSAVNHLIHESKRMRRVHINTKRLHVKVCSVAICVLIFLIVWTVLDAPKVVETAHLIEQGEPEVSVSTSCQSSSDWWVMTAYIWQGILLLSALILAVQSRNVKQEFNESQSLAFMVYSHTLFLILRALIYALPPENFPKSNIQSGIISICLSLDSINTLIVYFAPKFYAIAKKQDVRTATRSSISSAGGALRGADASTPLGYNLRSSGLHLNDSTNNIDFDEPPPQEEEIKLLMGEACDLLVQAAVEQDKATENGKDANTTTEISTSSSTDGTNNEVRIKKNHFMTQRELLLLRSICTRIGKARFDFENEGPVPSGASETSNSNNNNHSNKKKNSSDTSERTTAAGNGNASHRSAGTNNTKSDKYVSWASAELPLSSVQTSYAETDPSDRPTSIVEGQQEEAVPIAESAAPEITPASLEKPEGDGTAPPSETAPEASSSAGILS